MSDKAHNVLRPCLRTETEQYRNAVARVILSIQTETHDTLADIAENIGVSAGTISNAANKRSDLSPVFLRRMRAVYGLHHLGQVARFFDALFNPLEAEDADALPSLSASVHRLAVAQSPGSEGGSAITHRELLAMRVDLEAAQRAINALLARAEAIAA